MKQYIKPAIEPIELDSEALLQVKLSRGQIMGPSDPRQDQFTGDGNGGTTIITPGGNTGEIDPPGDGFIDITSHGTMWEDPFE